MNDYPTLKYLSPLDLLLMKADAKKVNDKVFVITINKELKRRQLLQGLETKEYYEHAK